MKNPLGRFGEELARQYLIKKGYKIIETNFRLKCGEIDIIARDRKELIFIEVKTRYFNQEKEIDPPLLPEEEFTLRKKKRLLKTIAAYLKLKKYPENIAWRLDLITIYVYETHNNIYHYENVII